MKHQSGLKSGSDRQCRSPDLIRGRNASEAPCWLTALPKQLFKEPLLTQFSLGLYFCFPTLTNDSGVSKHSNPFFSVSRVSPSFTRLVTSFRGQSTFLFFFVALSTTPGPSVTYHSRLNPYKAASGSRHSKLLDSCFPPLADPKVSTLDASSVCTLEVFGQ